MSRTSNRPRLSQQEQLSNSTDPMAVMVRALAEALRPVVREEIRAALATPGLIESLPVRTRAMSTSSVNPAPHTFVDAGTESVVEQIAAAVADRLGGPENRRTRLLTAPQFATEICRSTSYVEKLKARPGFPKRGRLILVPDAFDWIRDQWPDDNEDDGDDVESLARRRARGRR